MLSPSCCQSDSLCPAISPPDGPGSLGRNAAGTRSEPAAQGGVTGPPQGNLKRTVARELGTGSCLLKNHRGSLGQVSDDACSCPAVRHFGEAVRARHKGVGAGRFLLG